MAWRHLSLSLTILSVAALAANGQNFNESNFDNLRPSTQRPPASRAYQDQAEIARRLHASTHRDRDARPARDASTIQLPTFNFFTTTTTVSVPDGGTTFMGGIKRLSEGRNERGVPILGKVPGLNRLFKNVGIGRTTSAQNIGVTARIIILEEEEERQVGRAIAQRRLQDAGSAYALDPAIESKADFLSRHVARRVDLSPIEEKPKKKVPSLEEIRQRNALAQQKRNAEAVEYFEKGNNAQAAGKFGAAKIYFDMAARRSKGDFKLQALARLDALSRDRAAAKLASGD